MFKIFKNYGVLAAVSERKDGSMKVYADRSEEDSIGEHRRVFLEKLGVKTEDAVAAYLIHQDNIASVTEKDGGDFFEATDGFVTGGKGIFLTVTVSDCLPVFLFDPVAEVVVLAHAGWGGLEKGIIVKVVEKMKELGSSPERILVVIGPGMEKCHYEIGEDLAKKFGHIPNSYEKRESKIFLDIKAIARYQLLAEGVVVENMEINQECTFCEKEKYFSYRRDSYGRPEKLEAMMAVFGMRRLS